MKTGVHSKTMDVSYINAVDSCKWYLKKKYFKLDINNLKLTLRTCLLKMPGFNIRGVTA